MTARRQARTKAPVLERLTAAGEVPTVFAIGRCVDVWADPTSASQTFTAWRRFDAAREWWAARNHITDSEMQSLVPDGAPWTVSHLSYIGQAERAGRPVTELVAERLERAGCTTADLPRLRIEAAELVSAAET